MSGLNGTGPENKGQRTGRRLGVCAKSDEDISNYKLGQGMGLCRKTSGDTGKGKRLRSGSFTIINNNNS